MLISVDWEIRIAFLKNNKLEDYYHEQKGMEEEITGNIYTGVVEQVHSSINAAFVNIGLEKNAFLALDSVDYAIHPPCVNEGEKITIDSVLKEKDVVLVQVLKDATDTKGASLSTFVSLPGRYLVLSSNIDSNGISKKIVDTKEKTRLVNFLEKKNGSDHSVIVRTAAVGVPMKDIEREYRWLKKQWMEVVQKSKVTKNPALIISEQPLIIRTMRDHYHSDIDKILVNKADAFELVKDFLNQNYPDNISTLHFYNDTTPLFYNFNIEADVQLLAERKILLPCGGYIVIDQTEALVSIDVNSGSARSTDSVSKILFEINLEAAEEAARQIRLRNLSGLLVIDFIDMQNLVYRKKVEEVLVEAMKKDRSKHTIMPISELGLLEISRQKIGKNLATSSMEICSTCKGRGSTFSLITQTNKILRQIQNKAQTGNFAGFSIYGSPDLIGFLQKESISLLEEVEKQFDIKIVLEADKQFFLADEAEIHTEEREGGKKSTVALKPSVPSEILATVIPEKVSSDRGLAPHFLFKDVDVSNKKDTFKDFQEKSKGAEEKDSIHNKYLWKTPSTQVGKELQKVENTKPSPSRSSLSQPHKKKSFFTKNANDSFPQNRSTFRNRSTQSEQHSNDLSFRSIVKTEEAKNQNLWNKFKGFFSSKEGSSTKNKSYRKPQKDTTSSRRVGYSSRKITPSRGFSENTRDGKYNESSRGRTFSDTSRGRGRTFSENKERTFSDTSRGRGRTFSENKERTFSDAPRGRGRTFSDTSRGRGRTFSDTSRGRASTFSENKERTFSDTSRGRGRTFSENKERTFSDAPRGRGRTYSGNKERNFNK